MLTSSSSNGNNDNHDSHDGNGKESASTKKRAWQIPFWLSHQEHNRIGTILRRESASGLLLLGAIVLAIVAANSPLADVYVAVRDWEFGPELLHLHLSVGSWAADGLLAIYFFLVGLELKKEMKIGALRSPKRALVPVTAAFGGVLVPAIIFVCVVRFDPSYLSGWAIPTATDIAIAVTLLGVICPKIPASLRLFLLTLATVDDLIAILVIAVAYTSSLNWLPLAIAVVVIIVYRLIAVRYKQLFFHNALCTWIVLLPIGIIAWALVHSSGIHATIAGVVLGFMIPVEKNHPENRCLASEFEHRFRPLSSGISLPLFAFFSAGVSLQGWSGITASISTPLFLAVLLGLVVGKPIGITLTSWVMQKVTRGQLADGVRWIDMIGMSSLAGVGFTMSILISELSFSADTTSMNHAKIAVLAASTLAAIVAALILLPRSKYYAELERINSQSPNERKKTSAEI